ncbi:hypothetical protein ACMATS_06155 [Streptoverticillium reticulum]|uniref:hypothetical protein n=1 Tax=Streptoverticillium reticulum TaxID=1433415 RepID=UPI0039BF4C99
MSAVLSAMFAATGGAPTAEAAPRPVGLYQYVGELTIRYHAVLWDKKASTCHKMVSPGKQLAELKNQAPRTMRVWSNADCTGTETRVASGGTKGGNDIADRYSRSISFDTY